MTWIHMMRIHTVWIHMILWIHVYNDVGDFSSDWNHHVKLLATIVCWLRKNGFTINPLKCEWAVRKTDWLGLWVTPWGLMPWKKKIGAILHMDQSCNATELGCINYYCTCCWVATYPLTVDRSIRFDKETSLTSWQCHSKIILHWKKNNFHHSYSWRISRYALWCGHSCFYGT